MKRALGCHDGSTFSLSQWWAEYCRAGAQIRSALRKVQTRIQYVDPGLAERRVEECLARQMTRFSTTTLATAVFVCISASEPSAATQKVRMLLQNDQPIASRLLPDDKVVMELVVGPESDRESRRAIGVSQATLVD